MADEETSLVASQMLGELCTSVELESSKQNSPISDLDYGDDEDEDVELDQHLIDRVEDKSDNQNGNNEDTNAPNITNESMLSCRETNSTDQIMVNGNSHEHDDIEDAVDEVMMDAVDYADNHNEDERMVHSNMPNGTHRDDTAGETTDVISSQTDHASNTDDVMDGEYVIEKVIEKKLDSRGFAKYLVKWKGFPHSENTWEPLEHLTGCERFMIDFESRAAEKLAERYSPEDDYHPTGRRGNSNHPIKRKQTASRRLISAPASKEFEVNDVMGLTRVDGEMFYLVSLANSTQKTFIRAQLANKIIPGKVIDYFVKTMRWKSRS